jgi:hypothetical protein
VNIPSGTTGLAVRHDIALGQFAETFELGSQPVVVNVPRKRSDKEVLAIPLSGGFLFRFLGDGSDLDIRLALLGGPLVLRLRL